MAHRALNLTQMWSLSDWNAVAEGRAELILSAADREAVVANRAAVERGIEQGRVVYGVNTGFGALCTTAVARNDLQALQRNLIISHAAGAGPLAPPHAVRLMLAAKARNLALAHSGVRPELLDAVLTLYREDALPEVPLMGSLGASGDLAPLAHLSLALLGEAFVVHRGIRTAAAQFWSALGQKPQVLEAKEGLALINGTQFMQAMGLASALKAAHLAQWAAAAGTASLLAFDGMPSPFEARVHALRPHQGQGQVAQNVREWAEGSPLWHYEKPHVQDPYSFRCMPQVHGASRDAWRYVVGVLATESASVTDNPLVFTDSGDGVSAGHFHGQPLALAFDYAKIASAEWGSISERRINQLTLGKRGLPMFLANDSGVESGLMIVQYAAAALVSRNKQRATPASADSIDSSAGQEDHVSMGANAATDLYEVLGNVERILAMEWLCAVQAAERSGRNLGPRLEAVRQAFRQAYPSAAGDYYAHEAMEAALQFVRSTTLGDLDQVF
ncbi:MAG: HAL/PAL/TAL family ammonia-lyase [Schleiferiaceae bacterium]